MSVGPVLAAAWFPISERITCTALVGMLNSGGVAASFIIGPLVVDQPPPYWKTCRGIKSSDEETCHAIIDEEACTAKTTDSGIKLCKITVTPLNDKDRTHLEQQVSIYNFYSLGSCVAALLLILIFYRSKPPVPPSISAEEEREDFWPGLKKLLSRRTFWIIFVGYGVIVGAYSSFGAVFTDNVSDIIDQDEAGWIGFYATLCGCITGIGLGYFADRLRGKMRMILFCCCILAAGSFLWFALICANVLPKSAWAIYLTCLAGGAFVNGGIPLYYEWGVEDTYPISESIATTVLTTGSNIFSMIFLWFPAVPALRANYNWFMVSACGMAFLMLLPAKEEMRRRKIDSNASDCLLNSE